MNEQAVTVLKCLPPRHEKGRRITPAA